uniref:Transmembrane protein 188 n=1 Tax=Schistocephalus solidus TaxID=70667 RepID=A0A0X3PUD9_SCHSO
MMHFYSTSAPSPPPPEPTEDLKAFERRLREIVNGLHPKAKLWRIGLFCVSLSCLVTAYLWLTNPLTYQVRFLTSLANHPFFVTNIAILLILFLLGAHKKVVLPHIITQRCQTVLAEYNMTCDSSGKLILMPRPT